MIILVILTSSFRAHQLNPFLGSASKLQPGPLKTAVQKVRGGDCRRRAPSSTDEGRELFDAALEAAPI
jgi:hypothetical protein